MPGQAKYLDPKIVRKDVNDYVLKLGFHETEQAKALRIKTSELPKSNMMGDPTESAMFNVLLPAMGAKKVLEVGVFTGYTTLILAQAVGKDGTVVAMDITDEYPKVGEPYWKQAKVRDRIDLRIGPAAESLQGLIDDGQEGTYDFAFIDADKPSYQNYYELLLKLLRPNGIIAIDNVLWDGDVLDEKVTDEDTVALREISSYVYKDDRVEHVMLPFADGVTLVRKKA
eukprot:CAMPEP_0116825150 /NCGR_PEP_ID=MMETSP0418-20121206/1797_1 /TAXON_ID=1158023 /ORGANISM="Astrosyne radiata, Strain 13vi08-1A" /LENGTH=226 /DNA_ID=CAMNT_0004453609 /DNA_START=43 /DNA_END=723 /DNA_ORIENTATION=+